MMRIVAGLKTMKWGSLLMEFIVVVVGILTAFAWESYWDRRQEHAHVTNLLTQIRIELAQTEATLEAAEREMVHQTTAAAGLTRASLAITPPGEEQLRQWLNSNMVYTRPKLTLATLRATIMTGDLSLIQDQALRTKLSLMLERAEEYEAQLRDQVVEWLLPAWHEMHAYARWTSLQIETRPAAELDSLARADSMSFVPLLRRQPFPVELSRHLDDPAFHDLMMDTWAARDDLLSWTRVITQEVRDTQAAIDAWMEESGA